MAHCLCQAGLRHTLTTAPALCDPSPEGAKTCTDATPMFTSHHRRLCLYGQLALWGIDLSASAGHTGWRRVVLGHTVNTQILTQTKKSHNVLSEFMILCWASFTAILGCVCPLGRGLDTPARDSPCCPDRALGHTEKAHMATKYGGLWPTAQSPNPQPVRN